MQEKRSIPLYPSTNRVCKIETINFHRLFNRFYSFHFWLCRSIYLKRQKSKHSKNNDCIKVIINDANKK